ncbi:MAG: NADH-dependent flavin oxidoreductase [Lactobacillus sp.]|jgi:2,4-dienoyl-CoA reductase-like NADH-dependent reductase (Old Yellow Enzyme family)|nr:NADH-dependent flavin oxidoreductase [Lactobacillus sp.]MCH3906373.1 NADH-dependent flavin oxidoreductase [Lactobacillus sp.]MCI1466129.1 NADH-dependent flavin oxidoreductase [Lactobacillus sp.]MCI1481259.1 NADH-dependent flavin oxidoreductase [Lactobacillus sp.]MCI1883772.1 NADH-dependent flavin oxidoreductase [Lactobacillus sp.]
MMKQLSDQVIFRSGAKVNNRMVQPPMLTNSGNLGAVSSDTLAYWQARAHSAGLMITEYNYVSPAGGPAITWRDDRTQLAVYDDKFLPGLKKLAQTMKAGGNKAILQIAHTGREANYRAHLGLPVYAPDSANYSFLPYGVQAFTTEQVEQVVKDFGAAAKRAIEAGFDGVEIHGANHYLIQQFFSRFSNHRNDRWGKADAFPLAVTAEVMRVVKEFAPANFIVGYRISPEEINPGQVGYTWHESTKLVQELNEKFPLDYIHLSMGSYKEGPSDSDQTFAELFRPYLDPATKLIIVGNVMDGAAARDALQYTDLVAAGRAQLIDANFAAKIVASRDDEVIHELSDQIELEQKLTPGLQEVFNKETNRPDWSQKLKQLDYSRALKIKTNK